MPPARCRDVLKVHGRVAAVDIDFGLVLVGRKRGFVTTIQADARTERILGICSSLTPDISARNNRRTEPVELISFEVSKDLCGVVIAGLA